MNYDKCIEDTKEYIEQHLCDDIDAVELARRAGYSLYHFCRIFNDNMGVSLMRYIRNRRIEASGVEIKNGAKVAEVAMKYKFETLSGYTRAYKRHFGKTPTDRKK